MCYALWVVGGCTTPCNTTLAKIIFHCFYTFFDRTNLTECINLLYRCKSIVNLLCNEGPISIILLEEKTRWVIYILEHRSLMNRPNLDALQIIWFLPRTQTTIIFNQTLKLKLSCCMHRQFLLFWGPFHSELAFFKTFFISGQIVCYVNFQLLK